MSEPMEFQSFAVIACDELSKLRERAADAEREAAQEKARNAELAEQLRVAREATRAAVARAEGAEAERTAAEREAGELMASWHNSRDQHLADLGTLSRCLEARDKRVAELEDAVKQAPRVPAGYVAESWVRMKWDQALKAGEARMIAEHAHEERHSGAAKAKLYFTAALDFEQRMGWWR